MRKLGPLLAIIGGLFTTLMAFLALLVVYNVMEGNNFVGDYVTDTNNDVNVDVSTEVLWWIILIVGLVEVVLGVFAWKKARGIASFILIILFTVNLILSIVNGADSGEWPVSLILTIVIDSLAIAGLVYGFIRGN